MEDYTESTARHCFRCGDELPDGVRFCVACGTQNSNSESGPLAAANLEIKSHERRGFWQRVSYWGRFWWGIRW